MLIANTYDQPYIEHQHYSLPSSSSRNRTAGHRPLNLRGAPQHHNYLTFIISLQTKLLDYHINKSPSLAYHRKADTRQRDIKILATGGGKAPDTDRVEGHPGVQEAD